MLLHWQHYDGPTLGGQDNIRRATRKRHSAEEKIRIVLDDLCGETSIADLCRREGIAQSLYYAWSKEFLEAGKRRLAGDTARATTSLASSLIGTAFGA
jgi:transposase